MRSSLSIIVLSALIASAGVVSGAGAEDRYGPPPPGDPVATGAAPMTLLTWPGKTEADPAAPAAPVVPAASARDLPATLYAPARPAPTPAAYTPPAYAPAPYAPAPYTTAQGPGPTPSVAAANPPMTAGTRGEPPRYYSVHREYGLQPDPIALSPQFLANSSTADLAEPPPPLPPHLSAQNGAAASPASQNRAATQTEPADDSTTLN